MSVAFRSNVAGTCWRDRDEESEACLSHVRHRPELHGAPGHLTAWLPGRLATSLSGHLVP